ncbi:MAG: DUF5362 family protein [Calditrichia bacterium]
MEQAAAPTTPTPPPPGEGPDAMVLKNLKQTASDMSGWLKFLGIVNIISGALSAITIVGIIYAWLPIWMGVLLLQAGNSATNARFGGSNEELIVVMQKLKTFFILTGVLMIIAFAITIIALITVGAGLIPFISNLRDIQY